VSGKPHDELVAELTVFLGERKPRAPGSVRAAAAAAESGREKDKGPVLVVARSYRPFQPDPKAVTEVEVPSSELAAAFAGLSWKPITAALSTLALSDLASSASRLGFAATATKLRSLSMVDPALYVVRDKGELWFAPTPKVAATATATTGERAAVARELMTYLGK
jgi:hypothetical protein